MKLIPLALTSFYVQCVPVFYSPYRTAVGLFSQQYYRCFLVLQDLGSKSPFSLFVNPQYI